MRALFAALNDRKTWDACCGNRSDGRMKSDHRHTRWSMTYRRVVYLLIYAINGLHFLTYVKCIVYEYQLRMLLVETVKVCVQHTLSMHAQNPATSSPADVLPLCVCCKWWRGRADKPGHHEPVSCDWQSLSEIIREVELAGQNRWGNIYIDIDYAAGATAVQEDMNGHVDNVCDNVQVEGDTMDNG
jgi:hypothetical protein